MNEFFKWFSGETAHEALLTRPIETYLDEKTDIDMLFGYTSAVNEIWPHFLLLIQKKKEKKNKI